VTLTFDFKIQYSPIEVVEAHVLQNFIKLNAAFHELSWTQTFLPYLAMVTNPKIRSCDLDLWPVTLKFYGFRGLSRYMFLKNVIEL